MIRSLSIKNLSPGLVERGKIKIGEKGREVTSKTGKQFQPPVKLDHFVITTLARNKEGNFTRDETAHATLGERPTRVPVRLIYDDPELNFQTRMVNYTGRTLTRSCDGETVEERQPDGSMVRKPCVCAGKAPFADGVCKPYGVLSVMLDTADTVGGVWKFRTTAWNTVRGIMSSLALISRASGGVLAGLPLDLVVSPKSVANPDNGTQQTIQVVHIEYRGSLESLQDLGYKIALRNASHRERIANVETQARALLSAPEPGTEIDDEDAGTEFFPEQAAAAAGLVMAGERPAPNAEAMDFDPETGEVLSGLPEAAEDTGGPRWEAEPDAAGASAPETETATQAPPERAAPKTSPLRDEWNKEIGSYAKMGAWLDAFADRLARLDPLAAGVLWNNNAEVINRIGSVDRYAARVQALRAATAADDLGPDF